MREAAKSARRAIRRQSRHDHQCRHCLCPTAAVPIKDSKGKITFRTAHKYEGNLDFDCPARDYRRENIEPQIVVALQKHYTKRLRDQSPTPETDPVRAALFDRVIRLVQTATTRMRLRQIRREYQDLLSRS